MTTMGMCAYNKLRLCFVRLFFRQSLNAGFNDKIAFLSFFPYIVYSEDVDEKHWQRKENDMEQRY